MDITISKQVLEQAIKAKTEELAVLQLASDIVNEQFKAEFVALESAKTEANQKSEELSSTKLELQNITVEKEAQIKRADEAESKVADHEVTIASLTEEKTNLTSQVSALTEATQTSKDTLNEVVTTISDALTKAIPNEILTTD